VIASAKEIDALNITLEAGELNKMAAHFSHMAIKEASQINTVFKIIEDSCRARYFTQVRSA